MSDIDTQASDSFTAGLNAVRGTLAELRERRRDWERDVTALFDEFDSLAVQLAFKAAEDQQLAVMAAEEKTRAVIEEERMRAAEEECLRMAAQEERERIAAEEKSREAEARRLESEERTRQLAEQAAFKDRQRAATHQQLSAMRGMIAEQTDLLTAFISAATQFTALDPSAGEAMPCDPVVDAVKAEFDQFHDDKRRSYVSSN